MAAGRPVVATAVDGVIEAVTDGAGVLVPPGNVAALSAGLRKLLFDAEARGEASRAALSVSTTRYDPAAMMRTYDRLFARCRSFGSRRTRISARADL